MSPPSPRTGPTLPGRRPRGHPSQWPPALRALALLALSAALAAGLHALRLPAAGLLGPMLAAIALAVAGAPPSLPRPLFAAAQGGVGVMMASHLPRSVLPEIAAHWPLFLAGTAATLAVSALLGGLLARSGRLPGSTAIWGSTPGAAAAMTILSQSYGADMRLVACMQYLRVLCCAAAAALLSWHFHLEPAAGPAPAAAPVAALAHQEATGGLPAAWLAALRGPDGGTSLAISLGIAVLGVLTAQRLRVPGGALMLPLALGIAVQLGGLAQLWLPDPLLAVGFAVIGWSIGGRFTPEVLGYAARLLPMLLASVLTLIAANAGVALLLVAWADIDPLTAFLATNPGGADAVAIIAASSAPGSLDTPFVMSMQILRFLVVVLAGPLVARRLSRRG